MPKTRTVSKVCPQCHGLGNVMGDHDFHACPTCKGAGHIEQVEVIAITSLTDADLDEIGRVGAT